MIGPVNRKKMKVRGMKNPRLARGFPIKTLIDKTSSYFVTMLH